VLKLPTTNVTACTFGGSDMSTLFITSYTGRDGVAPNGVLVRMQAWGLGVSRRPLQQITRRLNWLRCRLTNEKPRPQICAYSS
jgi:hypothetical protein